MMYRVADTDTKLLKILLMVSRQHLDLPTNGTRLSTAQLNPQPPQHRVGGFVLMEARQNVMCRISKIWGQLRMKFSQYSTIYFCPDFDGKRME